MVFNSLTFLVFFAVVLLFHSLPLRWSIKKFNLLVASYVFYAAWNPPFVVLLILAAIGDFFLARWIARTHGLLRRRLMLTLSLCLNLGLLSYFKYGQFLLDNFIVLTDSLGFHYHAPKWNIALPLGISFYTFETISYLVDVYRGRLKPWESFVDYALFLTFFPHLVAGPIVRAGDFLPQCARPRTASARQLGWGLSLLVIGLFEKIILADACLAPVVDSVFGHAATASSGDAWIGAMAFSGQIFCDFAGYSTCGIGTALCLGFILKDNFRFPYAAVGFADFWQRWHISLSTWLRDYLYIPLGGNRQGRWNTARNLMITMLLGGLWHGASWRFVAWGGLHGSLLVAERVLKQRVPGYGLALRHRWVQVAVAVFTFLAVSVSWVLFRAANFPMAFHMVRLMCFPSRRLSVVKGGDVTLVLVLTSMLLIVHQVFRDNTLRRALDRTPWWLRSLGIAAALIAIVLAPGDNRAFYYFQF
jgi:alginate O-acetyltransferase complex protein AlgI